MNREIVRMNLTGLTPELRRRISDLAGEAMRAFTGTPEDAPAFNEARELCELIYEIEAGR